MSTTWKALASSNQQKIQNFEDDDWETDAAFENDITEKQQRWGSKTVEGSGRIVEDVNFKQVIEDIQEEDKKFKEQYIHESQKDVTKGFGGKYGVQSDRVDRTAVGWDYHSELNKHESQKDYSKGFGGKFGVQKDRKDHSAVGWDHHEKTEKHASQISSVKPSSVGKIKVPNFNEQQPPTESPNRPITTGKIKVPNFNQEKTLSNRPNPTGKLKLPSTFTKFEGEEEEEEENKTPLKNNGSINKGNANALKSKFENLIKESDSENQRKIEEERLRRLQKESEEKNKAKKEEEERQKKLRLEAEERKLNEVDEKLNKSDESSDDEQIVSSKVNKIGISVLPTQSTKQNSKSSNRSSLYDCDTENNLNDDQGDVHAIEIKSNQNNGKTNFIETNKNLNYIKETKIEQSGTEVIDQDEIKRLKEIELKSELEEEELRRKLAEEDESSLIEDDVNENKEIKAVALYDYERSENDEISFLPGDVISKIEKVDSGWWRGEVTNSEGETMCGLFPANFVEELK